MFINKGKGLHWLIDMHKQTTTLFNGFLSCIKYVVVVESVGTLSKT